MDYSKKSVRSVEGPLFEHVVPCGTGHGFSSLVTKSYECLVEETTSTECCFIVRSTSQEENCLIH